MKNNNIEGFKTWFKKTLLYFWIVLVMWESLRQAIPFKELRGRITEIVISLLAGFISVILLGQAGQIPDVGINPYTLAAWLVATVILRFLAGIFTSPSSLYRGMEEEANKRKWTDTSISVPKTFRLNPDGACLIIRNSKRNWKIHKTSIRLIRLIEGNNAMLESLQENNDIWIPVSNEGSFYPRKSLEPGESRAFSVAHWNDEIAWINTMNNNSILDKIQLKNDLTYRLTLKFIGEVDGKWMDENVRKYALRFVNHRIDLVELL